MIDWISKKQRERKRKEADEQALRDSLAEKISRYERSRHERSRSDEFENDDRRDFTELFINGKKLRVPKQEITVTDV